MKLGACPSCGGPVLRDHANQARLHAGRIRVECASCGEPVQLERGLRWSRADPPDV